VPVGSVKERVETSFDFVDLFAGLGGFHVALESLGGNAVFAAEWVEPLRSLYQKNYGLLPAGDITKVSPRSVPDHHVLAAGFPCQPFSKAGEQLGFEHTEQGQLFFTVARILRAKTPKYFILENVPNILKHRGGKTIEKIRLVLEEIGYTVEILRYSPHQFGVPQIRDRVYIVGRFATTAPVDWPVPVAATTDIRSILDKNPTEARALSASSLECLEVWDEFLKASPPDFELPSFPIWAMEFGADYPYEDETPYALATELGSRGLAQYSGSFGESLWGLSAEDQLAALPSHARREQLAFPKWKIDFIRKNREFYVANRDWIDPWLPRIRKFPSSFQKFEWNAKGERKNIWDFVLQFRASGVRVKRPTTAPSLVAMTDTQVPIIGWEKRYMTPRECSRLQSLGAIELPESRGDAYKALGNAVNASVVAQIAGALMEFEVATDARRDGELESRKVG